jgi:hypothetical protein
MQMQSVCVVQTTPVACDLQVPLLVQQGCVDEHDWATREQVGGGVERSYVPPLLPAMSAGTVGGVVGLMQVPVVEPGGTTQA